MSTRLQFRLSDAEAREIASRCPPELTLSAWLRQLALGQPVHRTRVRPHHPAPMPAGSEVDMAQARALASLVTQFADLLRRSAREPLRLSPALEADIRELAGQVRSHLLSK